MDIQALKSEVYAAAKDGQPAVILDLLSELNTHDHETIVQEVVNHHTEDGGQSTTPLIIATKNGRAEVIKVLLEKFRADTEQVGDIMTFDGVKHIGYTALCCEAATCQLEIVKMLVKHGANIDHKAGKNESPVTIACETGNIDVLKYLLTHIKDKTAAQHYRNKCLLLACYRAHYSVILYLIEVGAELNYKGKGGCTALHVVAYKNSPSLVKFLTDKGAPMEKNDYGVTPIYTAAALGYVHMVDYLIENYGCTKQMRVEVLELLGAFFITHDNNGIAKCYYFLQEAIKERYKNPGEILEKVILPPVTVYDNKIECKTLKELQEIEFDPVALCMESLAARERILGFDPLVPILLIKSGRWFFYQKSYDRCIGLWLHTLKHMQNIEIALSLDGFAEAYLKMHQLGQTVNFEKLTEVFQYAVFEIQLEKKQMTEGCIGQDDAQQFLFQRNIEICICIIAIMLREAITKAKKNDMYKVIQQLIQLKPVLANGFTVLHMCCDGAFLIKRVLEITEHITWDDSFPFASLCKTLIDCGVKVNALDNNKNSPLHILAKSASNIAAAFSTRARRSVRETLIILLENGAHIDSLNSAGETALDVATTKDVKDLIETYVELRLECLAAMAINIHGVKYQNVIPQLLQNFVELH